jgi:hypothetical protein
MRKFITLLFICATAFSAKAQQAMLNIVQPYGKVDNADLEMTSCDFEKDASAEVLIDKAELYYDPTLNINMDYHERIKVFNDNGKGHANIKLEYYSIENYEFITGLQAETINLVNGKQEITKLDKKQVYTQVIDKYRSAIVFSMPNVKAGSIIEYKYTWHTTDPVNIPTWFFQQKIPVKYSELNTSIPEYFYFSTQPHLLTFYANHATAQSSGSIGIGGDAIMYNNNVEQRVMLNIPSLADEPFMSSSADNLERISFVLTSFRPPNGFVENYSNTWLKVEGRLAGDEDFGAQLKRKLTDEETIIDKAKAMKTDDEKIAYIFNEVKNDMKWNGDDDWYTIDGTAKAWDKKTGNSTEVNLILYHLLKKSGVNAMPMVVSTREHGKVNPAYTFLYQFNRGVVYVPVDSTKYYILDATGKYNQFNETPYNLLNSSGLYLNMDNKTGGLIFLQKQTPVRKSVYINAEITPDGKMNGTAEVSGISFNRINAISRYKTDGETKYIDYLRNDDNNLKISSIKMENMDVDTLPLVQDISFNLDLSAADSYIYFVPNLFTSMGKNPFTSESRNTNIDFGYQDDLTVNSIYKIPAGYAVDALPKSMIITMPDKSITFKRIIASEDGTISARYVVIYNKTIYFKESYPDFHAFYKKMYELLNEQIVLKKS